MKNPSPINLKSSSEVRAEGWQAEARDADGHLNAARQEMVDGANDLRAAFRALAGGE